MGFTSREFTGIFNGTATTLQTPVLYDRATGAVITIAATDLVSVNGFLTNGSGSGFTKLVWDSESDANIIALLTQGANGGGPGAVVLPKPATRVGGVPKIITTNSGTQTLTLFGHIRTPT